MVLQITAASCNCVQSLPRSEPHFSQALATSISRKLNIGVRYVPSLKNGLNQSRIFTNDNLTLYFPSRRRSCNACQDSSFGEGLNEIEHDIRRNDVTHESCSVMNAFTSMVLIVREIQSYTLQMRCIVPYDELQSIIARVRKEIQISFIWLFRHVFSLTPTLMVYLMILMANFAVDSMAKNTYPPRIMEDKFVSSSLPVSIDDNDGVGEEDVLDSCCDDIFNEETKVEDDDGEDYSLTDMKYQISVAEDPNNSLLLANYAQFLYLYIRDYERAEEYFRRAVEVVPKDAEVYSKYAGFLWKGKDALWEAEEAYLAAIDAAPGNSFYVADYAYFLFSTGGEDTCFPLDATDVSL